MSEKKKHPSIASTRHPYLKIDIGHKKNGINNAVIEAGRYRNDEFNDYRLYGYTNSLQYVIIYTDSEIFVVSGKNKQQTQDIYEKLKEEINVV